jgi:hypothetical protein
MYYFNKTDELSAEVLQMAASCRRLSTVDWLYHALQLITGHVGCEATVTGERMNPIS